MRSLAGLRRAAVLAVVALTMSLLPGTARAGEAELVFRYRIESRGDVGYPIEAFAEDVRSVFADMRSVNLGGSIRYLPNQDNFDLTIAIASGAYIEQAAAVCDDEFSCRVGSTILINEENWRQTTPAFDGELDTYRAYLLNHEMGHFLGLEHARCPGFGPAPLMMQQSKGTGACRPNGFPLPYERQRIAQLHGVRVLNRIPEVITRPPIVPTQSGGGYWLVDELGQVRAFGDAVDPGSVRDFYSLDTGVVGAARNPAGGLYATAFGGELYAFAAAGGRAVEEEVGSAGDIRLAAPVVGMAADLGDGEGYWQVATDGGVFSFQAPFHGSAGGIDLARPIVGMAADPLGRGYWLVASDGGVFTYGDGLPFFGSAGDINLAEPVVGMAAHPCGCGYWLVAADGGVFTYGNIPFHGSAGDIDLAEPIVGMATTPDGGGYWLNAADGGVFTYGNAGFYGSGAG